MNNVATAHAPGNIPLERPKQIVARVKNAPNTMTHSPGSDSIRTEALVNPMR